GWRVQFKGRSAGLVPRAGSADNFGYDSAWVDAGGRRGFGGARLSQLPAAARIESTGSAGLHRRRVPELGRSADVAGGDPRVSGDGDGRSLQRRVVRSGRAERRWRSGEHPWPDLLRRSLVPRHALDSTQWRHAVGLRSGRDLRTRAAVLVV